MGSSAGEDAVLGVKAARQPPLVVQVGVRLGAVLGGGELALDANVAVAEPRIVVLDELGGAVRLPSGRAEGDYSSAAPAARAFIAVISSFSGTGRPGWRRAGSCSQRPWLSRRTGRRAATGGGGAAAVGSAAYQ